MAWYEWKQNNTGGSFDVDDKLTHRLFIEAETKDEAEVKAEQMGVYYDGCESGMDCECCGDRWYEGSLLELPYYSGAETVEETAQFLADKYGWCEPDARIFYKDGSVREVFTTKK